MPFWDWVASRIHAQEAGGTTWHGIRCDANGDLISMSTTHNLIHRGLYLGAGYIDTAVTAAADIEVLIQVSSAHDMHLSIKTITGGDATLDIYEGTTVSAAGTSVTVRNHNRKFSDTSNSTITHTPTITGDGTLIWKEYIPGGSTGVAPGAIQQVSAEQTVFKANTNYLFRLTNNAAVTEPLQIQISFYEIAT